MLISPLIYSPRRSLKWSARDGGVYDKHRDGSAEYYAPSGHVRHYNPPYYNDEDKSDGSCSSSESPEESDSERDDYRGRGYGRGYYASDDRGVARPLDSESSSSEDVPDSGSETETDDHSGRYVPDEYESGSHDRDDHDSYGDSYDDWEDDDYDDYGEYDGMFILLLTRFSAPVYSFIPRLRRRLRLLSLDQDYQRLRLILYHLVVHKVVPSVHSSNIHLHCFYQSVSFGGGRMSDMFPTYMIPLDRGAYPSEKNVDPVYAIRILVIMILCMPLSVVNRELFCC